MYTKIQMLMLLFSKDTLNFSKVTEKKIMDIKTDIILHTEKSWCKNNFHSLFAIQFHKRLERNGK